VIFRNTAAQTVAYISGYVLSFIIAPVMLAELGLAAFGIWAVSGAFATYAGLMDLGIKRSVERFVALHHARDDHGGVAQCLGLGLLVVTGVAVPASGAAVVLAAPLAGGLDEAIAVDDLRAVLLASVGIFILNAYRFVLDATAIGMQRMVPPAVSTIVYGAVSFVLSLWALLASGDLLTYALANVAAAGVGVVASVAALHVAWPAARVRRPSRTLVGGMLGYGVKSQVSWIAELVNLQADKVIIAVAIDVRAAGAYEIANRAVIAVRTVSSMSLSALLPAATIALAREGTHVVRSFYRHYALRAMSVALPLLIVASVTAPALLVAWLGEVPTDATAIFIALTLANVTNIGTGVASSIWMGEGNAGILALFATGSALANIALTVALTPAFGMWGVIGATIATITGTSVVALWQFHRTHPVPIHATVRALGAPVLLSLAAASPILLWLLVRGVPSEARIGGAVTAAGFVAVFVAIYWPAATRTGILPAKLALRFPRRLARAGQPA
jgi:O-antigen/teichoic acid export membrane protein